MNPELVSAIVYLLRKTNLPLKIVDDGGIKRPITIGELEANQFAEIVNELQRQEAQEEYNENYRTASLMAAIYNTVPRSSRRVFSPKDFLPDRKSGEAQDNLEKLAAEENIITPQYKPESLKER